MYVVDKNQCIILSVCIKVLHVHATILFCLNLNEPSSSMERAEFPGDLFYIGTLIDLFCTMADNINKTIPRSSYKLQDLIRVD